MTPSTFILSGIGRGRAVRAVALVSAFLLASSAAFAETIKISGTGASLATMQNLGKEFAKNRAGVSIEIQPNLGSGGSIKALLAGALDVAIATRPVKPEEQARGAISALYAKTPFVIATAQGNKTSGFALREIAGIYAGRIANWPDNSPIRLVLRPQSDSDTPALAGMSAEMKAAMETAFSRRGLNVAMTDQEAGDALEKIPGAIGSTTLALVVSEKRALKPLAINGVAPSVRSIGDGSYPWHKSLYFITTGKSSPLVAQFASFIRSPAGRAILAENGQLAATE